MTGHELILALGELSMEDRNLPVKFMTGEDWGEWEVEVTNVVVQEEVVKRKRVIRERFIELQ